MSQKYTLTEEEKALLNTQFSPEIEKIAEVSLKAKEAIDVLRAYGAALAEEEIFDMLGRETLQKTASMNKQNLGELANKLLNELGSVYFEKEASLSEEELGQVLFNEAQAAAIAIAEGYLDEYGRAFEESPELVKEAARRRRKVKKEEGGLLRAMQGQYRKLKKNVAEKAEALHKSMKKHPGKYTAGGALLGAGLGAGLSRALSED